jgi:hypothetical protein
VSLRWGGAHPIIVNLYPRAPDVSTIRRVYGAKHVWSVVSCPLSVAEKAEGRGQRAIGQLSVVLRPLRMKHGARDMAIWDVGCEIGIEHRA